MRRNDFGLNLLCLKIAVEESSGSISILKIFSHYRIDDLEGKVYDFVEYCIRLLATTIVFYLLIQNEKKRLMNRRACGKNNVLTESLICT